jgi:hypothetical protein
VPIIVITRCRERDGTGNRKTLSQVLATAKRIILAVASAGIGTITFMLLARRQSYLALRLYVLGPGKICGAACIKTNVQVVLIYVSIIEVADDYCWQPTHYRG